MEAQKEKFVYNMCPSGMYCGTCNLKTIVEDGKIVRTEKTTYTGPEADQGLICQKGIAAARYPYLPNRLLHPLKRTGERGEGKWQQISWEQAMDEIGEKLVKIRDQHGPQAVTLWTWPGGVGAGLGTMLPIRFENLFGSTDCFNACGVDNGPMYAGFIEVGAGVGVAYFDPNLINKSKYILISGCNPIENNPRVGRYLAEAKERGVKVVDIGLVFDGSAGFADQFIGVKPGTDAALMLSMAQVIVEEGKTDQTYLLNHTVAPFLVRDDDGKFLRDNQDNYLVWDEATGKAVGIPPKTKDTSASTRCLTGEFVVDSVPCKPAFQVLINHLAEYTPEATEAITGIAPAVVRQVAREFADAKPAMIFQELGMRYQNAGDAYRANYLLAELTGNVGIPGGGITGAGNVANMPPAVLNDYSIMFPDGMEQGKARMMRLLDWWEAVKTGKPYPIKAMIKTGGNPVQNMPSRDRWINEIFPNLDLIVDFDIWMTDTSEYADYVLPDCSTFERTDIANGFGHITLLEPAIAPLGECRPIAYFMGELAKRVGLGEFFDKTQEEWAEMRLQSTHPSVADITPTLTYNRLKDEKMVRANVPAEPIDIYSFMLNAAAPTASGRFEFYKEELADLGEALVCYVPALSVGDVEKRKQHPYQFFSGRHRFVMQSYFIDDPWLAKLSGGQPAARMNPVDAARENLHDGDMIECFNHQGKLKVILRLEEGIPPGSVQVWYGWRRKQFEEGKATVASLITNSSSPESTNALAHRWWKLVEDANLRGPFILGFESGNAGAWDVLWDAVCDVRKVNGKNGGQK